MADTGIKYQEVERKFLLQDLPISLVDTPFVQCERHYIYFESPIELRVQRKNDVYELERKIEEGSHSWIRNSFKIQISELQFNDLGKSTLGRTISFKKYRVTPEPRVSIKKYEGVLDGFLICEIEFDTLEDAKNFQPFEWMGREVSGESYARDSGLIYLTEPPIVSPLA